MATVALIEQQLQPSTHDQMCARVQSMQYGHTPFEFINPLEMGLHADIVTHIIHCERCRRSEIFTDARVWDRLEKVYQNTKAM